MGPLSFVFLAVFLAANAYFAYRASMLVRLAQTTTGPVWSGNRLDRVPERISTFVANVLGQKAVLRKKNAGIMHAAIFWGFIIITTETIQNFAWEIHPGFTFEFIGPTAYSALVAVQDLFTLAVLVAVLYAYYRRLVVRPEGLGKSKDAIIILTLTGSLMVSLFTMRAFRQVAHPEWFDQYEMISGLLARHLVEPVGFSPATASAISSAFRWVHHLLVLGFLCYIPSSKHLHVLTAAPNTFLRTLDIPKGMRKVNLEDENATSFGVGKVSDLSWKDTLDLYACTECGRCQDACPAHNTQKPLSPKALNPHRWNH
ncbi:MAG: hypothetical protein HY075_06660 [Deltaproteobacteria bacterium]|nr:hypothetical protein [Deltaproteobacteria bacterium]